MKVLILVLALFALVYSQEETVEDAGTIEDPSTLGPEWVLQPDGSYLKTIQDPGQVQVVNQEVNIDNAEYDENEYKPKFSNGILSIGDGENKGVFKITRGDNNNENDYSVEPVVSEDDLTPLNSDDKEAPQVYPEGTQGQPDYQNILGVGKGPNRGYLLMKPDSSKPSGFKFIPQYISSYSTVPGEVQPNAPEPTEDDEEEEIPDSPEIKPKKGYSVITVGRPGCRRFVKLTPSKNNNAYDFDLKPIKHPDQPDSKPDDDDDDQPEIIENGKRGTPDYQPVIASGPTDNRRYVGVAVDPKNPKHFTFVPANPQTDPAEAATEPNEDDVEYEDVPTEPKYITVKTPGNKIPVGIVSLGHAKHRVHFKIVRRSNKPGDVQVEPIRDPDHLNSSPDAKNEHAPEVCQQGDPSDENNAPIVATGPRFRRRYYKMVIRRNRVKFIPVRRLRIRGTNRYRYVLMRRRWHYRRPIRRVIRHHRPATRFIKRTIVRTTQRRRNTGGFFGNIFGGLFGGGGGGRRNVAKQVVLRRPVGKVVNRKVVTHKVVTHSKGRGLFGGLFG